MVVTQTTPVYNEALFTSYSVFKTQIRAVNRLLNWSFVHWIWVQYHMQAAHSLIQVNVPSRIYNGNFNWHQMIMDLAFTPLHKLRESEFVLGLRAYYNRTIVNHWSRVDPLSLHAVYLQCFLLVNHIGRLRKLVFSFVLFAFKTSRMLYVDMRIIHSLMWDVRACRYWQLLVAHVTLFDWCDRVVCL